jgi:coenzyme F420-0:L-glutamate ligase/coenzyme F420-1:gamma-L-glutamate ligase
LRKYNISVYSIMHIIPLENFPLIQPGDDLAGLIVAACRQQQITLTSQDMVVIAQKVVSKAENCFVDLRRVKTSVRARELADITRKPAALVEVILQDSREVIRAQAGLLIVQHRLGFICANAGVDHSNVSQKSHVVLRLPSNPDASARVIRQEISRQTGAAPPVLIIDSHGRAWRFGTVGVTIGLSGIAPVQDLRGTPDLFGSPLEHTEVGFADQIAAAASLMMGQAAEACPVVILRGLEFEPNEEASAAAVLRPKEADVFR